MRIIYNTNYFTLQYRNMAKTNHAKEIAIREYPYDRKRRRISLANNTLTVHNNFAFVTDLPSISEVKRLFSLKNQATILFTVDACCTGFDNDVSIIVFFNVLIFLNRNFDLFFHTQKYAYINTTQNYKAV